MTERCPFSIPMRQDEVITKELEDQFDLMRESGSLARANFPYGTRHGGEGWVATGYKEVKQVLMDNRLSLAQQFHGDYPRARAMEVDKDYPSSFITMDPPDQSERRRTLMKHLTPQRVKSLRPFTEKLVSDCLDEIERQGPGADLLPNFVYKVPLFLLCELLGAPPEERHIYVGHAADFVCSRHETPQQAAAALRVITEYFQELVRRKRANPGDDLISAMIHDTEVKGLWTEEELDGVGTILLMAGHDSTSAFISNALHWLVHNPDVFAKLRAEPDLVPKATDEFLRLLPVGVPGSRSRVAMEDIEVGDKVIERDQIVLAIPHAANMDPSVFECPHEFSFERSTQHVAFGFGTHFCPGSQLARMDIDVILRGVTQRFEKLEPFEYDPNWFENCRTRGPKTLRVKW